MKVIFLDIDGVLQSPRYCVAIGQTGFLQALEPAALHMLRHLVVEAGAKVVISSSWRHGSSKREFNQLFRVLGFKEISNAIHEHWRTADLPHPAKRGDEIKAWLREHSMVTDYLILDDDDGMLIEQAPYFVRTCPFNGILLDHFEQACRVLGIKIPGAAA